MITITTGKHIVLARIAAVALLAGAAFAHQGTPAARAASARVHANVALMDATDDWLCNYGGLDGTGDPTFCTNQDPYLYDPCAIDPGSYDCSAYTQDGAVHANPPQVSTYVNATQSYSLRYPRAWSTVPQASLDLAVMAPDSNGAVVAVARRSPDEGPGALRTLLPQFFRSVGQVEGTPVLRTIVSHGVREHVALARYRSTTGTHGKALLLLAFVHGRAYFVAGVVPNSQAASAKADGRQVASIVTSLTFR